VLYKTFLGVLLDHLIYSASVDNPSFAASEALLSNIVLLAQSFPITCATQCISKLSLMQKNLTRGLQAGPLLDTSKTWPGAGELALLRIVGTLWSTSDFSHPVAAPAMLLICQYLGQCRVRSLKDVAAGLFLTSLVLQYETMSKRLVPEVLNFLAQILALLFPLSTELAKLPGDFPMPDFQRPELEGLVLDKGDAQAAAKPNLLSALSAENDDGSVKAGLAQLALACLGEFAGAYNTLPAFIELYQPVLDILSLIDAEAVPQSLQVGCSSAPAFGALY
jgi:nucleolar protein 14